uniref:Uncharacterized protein n=1 Tax=Oryza glumipatula TaxID=40148 RepID=A0A0D9ZP75_9ORYZ
MELIAITFADGTDILPNYLLQRAEGMTEKTNPDGEEVVDGVERWEGGRRCAFEDAPRLRIHLRCGRHGPRRG